MGEYRYGERFEILRRAEAAAIQKGHSLRGAVEHLRAARRNPEQELIRVARLAHDGKCITYQRVVYPNLRDSLLHFHEVGAIQHGFHPTQLPAPRFATQNLRLP